MDFYSVHLIPGNALFYVHLLLAWHQFIWFFPLIYNNLLNKRAGIQEGYTVSIFRSMQALPQGSLFNVHPHTHALVPVTVCNPPKSP